MTLDLPRERLATFDVLLSGSLTDTGGGVASSCSLIREDERAIVVDPGMATGRDAILGPLRARARAR
jgi:hypothetical protein